MLATLGTEHNWLDHYASPNQFMLVMLSKKQYALGETPWLGQTLQKIPKVFDQACSLSTLPASLKHLVFTTKKYNFGPNLLQEPDHPRPLQKVGLKFWQSCFKKPIQKFHCTQKATSQKLSYFIWNEQVMTTFFHSRELTSHMVHTCSSYTSAALLAFLSLASVSMNSLVQGLSNCTSARCEQPSA